MNSRQKTTRSSSWGAGNGKRPSWLLVLMLTFIIFICLDYLPPMRHQNQQEKQQQQQQQQNGNQYLLAQSNRFIASRNGGGGRFVTLASAAYLDSIGQITNVLSELVNSVLEKVSFLAEIVIESSMNEECLSPIASSLTSPASKVVSSCDSYARKHNLTVADLGGSAGGGIGVGADITHVSRDKFDENEYKNVDVFLESYYHPKAPITSNASASSGSSGAGAKQVERETGCKLFTLDKSQRDLPVEDMTICCNRFGRCYNSCGQLKLDCDLDFRQCLTTICKQNFDYKNASIIEKNLVRLTKRDLLESEYELLPDSLDDVTGDFDEHFADSSMAQQSGSTNGARKVHKRSHQLDPSEPEADMSAPSSSNNNNNDNDNIYGDENRDKDSGSGEDQAATPLPMDDMDTKTTVKRLRDKYKACKLASKLLIIGNLAFGCQSYRQSQWRACCSGASASYTKSSSTITSSTTRTTAKATTTVPALAPSAAAAAA